MKILCAILAIFDLVLAIVNCVIMGYAISQQNTSPEAKKLPRLFLIISLIFLSNAIVLIKIGSMI